jgi:predicted nuclease of restriction endonuclease-like RecB superfamily
VLKKYCEFKNISREDKEKFRTATYKKIHKWSTRPACTASTNNIVTKLLKRLEMEFEDWEHMYTDEDDIVDAYGTICDFAKQLAEPPE